jgi:hypothetical protein
LNTYKMCNTDDLLDLVKLAQYNGFNRQVDIEQIERIVVPDGPHLVVLVLPFHNGDHADIPHHRCDILVRTILDAGPTKITLDIAEKDFDRLHDIPAEMLSGVSA